MIYSLCHFVSQRLCNKSRNHPQLYSYVVMWLTPYKLFDPPWYWQMLFLVGTLLSIASLSRSKTVPKKWKGIRCKKSSMTFFRLVFKIRKWHRSGKNRKKKYINRRTRDSGDCNSFQLLQGMMKCQIRNTIIVIFNTSTINNQISWT